MPRFELVVHSEGADPKNYPVNGKGVVIGRSNGADIIIEGNSVSRRHARVSVEADGLSIQYLGSRDGLDLNGTFIKTAPLKVGDRFAIGECVVVVQQAGKGSPTPVPARRKGAPKSTPKAATLADDDAAFQHIARIFGVSTSVDDLMSRIVKAMVEAVNGRRGFFFEPPSDPDGEPKMVAYHARFDDNDRDGPVLSRAVVEQVFEQNAKVKSSLRRKLSANKGGWVKEKGLICVPLMANGQCLGAAYIDTPRGRSQFSEEECDCLVALGRAAGIAIVKAYRT